MSIKLNKRADLRWYARYESIKGQPFILYAETSKGLWDGDETGVEWKCGYAIHFLPNSVFSLYEDDGRGNGNFCSSWPTLQEATEEAECLDAKAGA